MTTATGAAHTWLVAYDIREPRRLRRVHKCLRRHGMHVQYSVFTLEAHHHELAHLLHELRSRIDPQVDDVRAYRLPTMCKVWKLGRQDWPDGVDLVASEALEQLATLQRAPRSAPDDAVVVDPD